MGIGDSKMYEILRNTTKIRDLGTNRRKNKNISGKTGTYYEKGYLLEVHINRTAANLK